MKHPRALSFIVGAAAPTDPADADIRYFGAYTNLAFTTTQGARRFYIPKKGRIVSVMFVFAASTAVVGTNENIVAVLRKNSTTDYAIATVATTDVYRLFNNENMNVPVAVGDYFEIKITCPTWVTNPTQIQLWGVVIETIP